MIQNQREEQLTKLNGGHYDVLILGNGAAETAIFASLSTKSIPVALISEKDFGSNTNQDIPFLENDKFENNSNQGLTNSYLINKSSNKIENNQTFGVEKLPYLSLINEKNRFSLAGASTKILTNSLIHKSGKPRLFRKEYLKQAEPDLDTKNFKGGIEHKTIYFPDGIGRAAINLIKFGLNANINTSACNYLKIGKIEKHVNKPWEIDFIDLIGNKKITLLAQVVIQSQNFGEITPKEFTINNTKLKSTIIRNTHATVPKFTSEQFIQIKNNKNKITITPTGNQNIITLSEVVEIIDLTNENNQTETVEELLNSTNKEFSLKDELTKNDLITTWTTFTRKEKIYKNESIDDPSRAIKNQIELDAVKNLINLYDSGISSAFQLSSDIEKIVKRCGIKLRANNREWHNSENIPEKQFFYELTKKMNLFEDNEQLVHCLWTRHRSNSFKILEIIDSNRSLSKTIIEDCNYIWAEIAMMRNTELISSLDDFLYQRTNLGYCYGESIYEKISVETLKKALLLSSSPKNYHKILEV